MKRIAIACAIVIAIAAVVYFLTGALASHIEPCERGTGFDHNGDGVVGAVDLGCVAAHYGPLSTATPTRVATATPVNTATATPDATASPAIAPCAVEESRIAYDAEEQEFLRLLNEYRVANGRVALTVSYTLTKAAAWKSRDMGVNAYFTHDDQSRTWVQRIRDCGYTANAALGENIAAGMSSGAAAFGTWRGSAGHNAIMLGTSYRVIGVGREFVAGSPYGWYWTAEFASVDDGSGGL